MASPATPVTAAEARALFADFSTTAALVLAVSGGPDSMALLLLAARWRAGRRRGPALIAVTVDHGLRPESAREAAMVARLARRLGVAHRTLRWHGAKPETGLQQAARAARYRLLAEAARKAGARHILTAHTLDDQAETVLYRLARGSGVTGLGAMTPVSAVPVEGGGGLILARPLLGIPKARLIATVEAAGVGFAEDPSNADPRFARTRLRSLLPGLAEEGLDARRLAQFARRMRRADAALDAVAEALSRRVAVGGWPARGALRLDARDLARLPAEIRLRLIRRALVERAQEGAVALARLESLLAALDRAMADGDDFRRTLAGALVSLADDQVVIAPAPPRAVRDLPKRPLTTPERGRRAKGNRR
jgi:tRNA(Ile)-lysidine synthase